MTIADCSGWDEEEEVPTEASARGSMRTCTVLAVQDTSALQQTAPRRGLVKRICPEQATDIPGIFQRKLLYNAEEILSILTV